MQSVLKLLGRWHYCATTWVKWHGTAGFFKASWDQLNYDVVGDTDTTSDSFLLPGGTYAIYPTSRALDADSRHVLRATVAGAWSSARLNKLVSLAFPHPLSS